MDYSFVWELFLKRTLALDLKVNQYLINTIKHIDLVSRGIFPAFVPALDDTAAPIAHIEKAYITYYGLNDFMPIIMQPAHLENGGAGYYSINFPTLLDWFETPKYSTGISLVRQIKELCLILKETIAAPQVDFDFYHINEDKQDGIKDSELILADDANFSKLARRFKGMVFPKSAVFFKGCIKIMRN